MKYDGYKCSFVEINNDIASFNVIVTSPVRNKKCKHKFYLKEIDNKLIIGSEGLIEFNYCETN